MNVRRIRGNPWLSYGIVASALLLAVSLGWAGAVPVLALRGQISTRTPTPYTVTLQQYRIYANGERKYANTSTYAVRSDGSTAAKIGTPPNRPADSFHLIRLSNGATIQLRHAYELKTTISQGKPPRLRAPDLKCVLPGTKEQLLGEETASGFRAVKVQFYNITRWFALDHGCALIGERFIWDDGTSNEKVLVSLISGEPDFSLFHVPESYKEVAPSKWHDPEAIQTTTPAEREYFSRADQQYNNQRDTQ
jgi:hypothetical protein